MPLFQRGRSDSASVERRIRKAIAEVRPLLHIDPVGIDLVRFEWDTGVAVVKFEGDCPDCAMSASMMRSGVEAHIRMHVPEVREVRAV
jgi:Fe-S cluster biogenesis protein NfuA